jgi:DNA mismatch repair protein MutS
MSETTPMMAQYLQIKEQHRDAVLFFRLGDFYEMFNDDAVEISRLLNLTLTQRSGNPMCGIPFHASKVYIARLLRAGKKIAICEQLSIPGPGKGLAERKVVEVITPGTAVEDDYLEQTSNNYLAALSSIAVRGRVLFGFAYIDVSTGEFAATSFAAEECGDRLAKELGRIQPREILIQQSLLSSFPVIPEILDEYPSLVQNRYPDWAFNRDLSCKRLCAAFGTTGLQAFSLDSDSAEVPPAGMILEYLERTSGPVVSHVSGIRIYSESEFVSIDESTRKNLELVRNLRDGTAAYTLLDVLDETRTSMGGRLLRNWIQHPLTDAKLIQDRLARLNYLYREQKILSSLRNCLADILDIERLSGRVAMERAHGKDLLSLGQSLSAFLCARDLLAGDGPFSGVIEARDLEAARATINVITAAIRDDCPVVINEGGIIRDGWSERLDELRLLRDNSNAVLEEYLESERQKTGIANLKIRYNRMIGYYLEVSKGNLPSVPEHFIRRRSLANGDRYTTDRLVELETELNGVFANINECEQKLFIEVRSAVFAHIPALMAISRAVAEIDVLQSFSQAATVRVWVCPEFVDGGVLEIENGRHPVVEAHLPTGEFVPNSITVSSGDDGAIPSFALITGPNMAGKSTFLRQTALIAIMAQIGSFVPADSVRLSAIDRIFCRVGAQDNLARGESTFLVEMTETAHILRTATRGSLVIMDEVGRGTSTEDGLSIARAVTEYLIDILGVKTLFATHYHELSRLEHPRLAGYCLDVLETEGQVVFLKKVRPGASANSYGIHVARLAGVPEPVLARAGEILSLLTGHELPSIPAHSGMPAASSSPGTAFPGAVPATKSPPGLFSEEELVIDEILSSNPDAMTPLEALTAIAAWKKKLFPAG